MKLLSEINHFPNTWEKSNFEVILISDFANVDTIPFRLCLDKYLISRIAEATLKYHVLVCSTAPSLLVAYKARKIGFRGTVIFDDFGVWHWRGFATGIWGPLGAFFPAWAKTNIRYSARSIDLVLTPSNFQKKKAISEYGLDPRIIFVVPYPVEDMFNPMVAKGNVRKKLNIGKDIFLVLFVGRLNPTKKVDTLIEALRILKPLLPIKLLIVGRDQGSKRKLLRLVNKLHLTTEVIFVDQVPRENMPEYYADCDVLATASVYESYCYPIAEAYACGKTVVAANSTAIPEVVGDAGFLCAPNDPKSFADALLRLYQNPLLRKKLEKRGLKRSTLINGQAQRTISSIAKQLTK